jgi:hypothetical protein
LRLTAAAVLPSQLPSRERVLDRGCPDLLEILQEVDVSRRLEVLDHEPIATTPSCHVNLGLSCWRSLAETRVLTSGREVDSDVRTEEALDAT